MLIYVPRRALGLLWNAYVTALMLIVKMKIFHYLPNPRYPRRFKKFTTASRKRGKSHMAISHRRDVASASTPKDPIHAPSRAAGVFPVWTMFAYQHKPTYIYRAIVAARSTDRVQDMIS
jgi:hypothetical protein